MAGSTAQRLEGLQVLRFLAALLVLSGHLVHEAVSFGYLPAGALSVVDLLPWAAGVDIFFVISGFIMFHISGEAFGRRGAAREFLLRRLQRLVPLYWLFTLAMLLAMLVLPERLANAQIDAAHVAASFLFLPFVNAAGLVQPVLALGWTLNYEMFFYLMFGVCLLVPGRAGPVVLAAALVLLVAIHPLVPQDLVPLRFWTDPIILEFLAGMGIAFILRRGVELTRHLRAALLLAGVAGLIAGALLLPHAPGLRVILFGLPAALVVMWTVSAERRARTAGHGLVLAGDASYALYLSHPFSVNLVALVLGQTGIAISWLFVPAALLVSLGVSVAVFLVFERPLLGLMRGRRTSLPPATGAAQPVQERRA